MSSLDDKLAEIQRRTDAGDAVWLRDQLIRSMRGGVQIGRSFHDMLLALQGAWIASQTDEKHLDWIENTLAGPGLFPDVSCSEDLADAWIGPGESADEWANRMRQKEYSRLNEIDLAFKKAGF